jgi:hypothetical protein
MRSTYLLLIPALVLQLLVVAAILLWFGVSASDAPFEQQVQAYLSHFPSFLQHARLLTVINIVLLAISAWCYARLRQRSAGPLKAFSAGAIIFNGLLIAWQLFTLM